MKLLVTVILFSCCICCNLATHSSVVRPKPAEDLVALKPVKAVFVETEHSLVGAKTSRITPEANTGDRFRQALFVNQRQGWASTEQYVYRTSDGGDTWQRLTFRAGENSQISSITFVDEFHGWLAITKQVYTERYGLGNSSQIWTTNDSGTTWRKQVDLADEIKVRQIRFLNAKNGFAIGARVIDRPRSQGPAYDEILILSSSDGGTNWTDVSEGAKTEIRKQGGIGDYGWDIRWRSPTEALLLTRGGRIMETSDRANTWKPLVRFQDERPTGFVSSTGYYKLVFDTDQRVRVIAGATGDEGYWGDLVIRDEDNSWKSYELTGKPIYDAVFLSKDEVLACGQEIRSHDDKRTPAAGGIILRSLDAGKSWNVIYRSEPNEAFFSLHEVNSREFFVVSDSGTFLKFRLD